MLEQMPSAVEGWIERFWSKVERQNPCWFWMGTLRKADGIGVFSIDGRGLYAHRVAWIISYGTVPDGVEVRRSCNNQLCVRPSHLHLQMTLRTSKSQRPIQSQ